MHIALLLTFAAVSSSSSDWEAAFLAQIRVARQESWLQHEIRKFRSYPHLDRAYRLMEDRRLTEARAEFERYLAIDPVDTRVRAGFLVLLWQLGEHQELVRQADLVLEASPQFVPALVYRALAFESLNRDAAALEDLRAAAGHPSLAGPEQVFVLSTLVDVALGQGKFEEALRALDRLDALSGLKGDFGFSVRRGLALEKLGRLSESAAAYRQALGAARDTAGQREAYRALARVSRNLRDWQEARRSLLAALALDPQDARLMLALGEVSESSRDYAEAVRWHREALRTGQMTSVDERHRVFMTLGRAYTQLGQSELAYQAFREAAELRDDASTWTEGAQALERKGHLAQSIDLLENAVKRRPTPEAHLQLGVLLSRKGEVGRALEELERAQGGTLPGGQRAQLERELGFLYHSVGKYADARRAFEEALRLDPKDAVLHSAAGETALALGDHPEAIRHFRESVKSKDEPFVWRALAMAQSKAGYVDEALAIYRRLLEGEPRPSPGAAELLATMGNLTFSERRYSDAASLFLDAYESAPERWPALIQASEALTLAGKWRDAVEANHLLLAHPNLPSSERPPALERLGHAFASLDEPGSATASFRDAIAAGRDDWRIRLDLGINLGKLERWNEALSHFLVSLERNPDPRTLLYVGRSFIQLGKPGMAIYYLRQAQAEGDALEPEERKRLNDELSHLYAEESDYARAAEACEISLSMASDPEIRLRLARMRRLLGQNESARKSLSVLQNAKLPLKLQAQVWDELSLTAAAERRWAEAITTLRQVRAVAPAVEQQYRLGVYSLELGDVGRALAYLEAAVEEAPGNTRFLSSLGYAQARAHRFREAATQLEEVLKREPDRVGLSRDVAYDWMRAGENGRARRGFERAIDEAALLYSLDAPDDKREQDVYALRQEVHKLRNRFDLTAYLGSSSDALPGAASPESSFGSQFGLEVSYQPPGIGFRSEKSLQVFARLLGSRAESLQGGLGFRLKPLRSQNLSVGVERLFRVGEQSIDSWLLRGLYSWDRGYDLKPTRPRWSYSLLFSDLAHFTDSGDTLFYGELRQGVTWNWRDSLLFTPHFVWDGREQSRAPSSLETGAGVSVKYLFNETRYEAHRSSVEARLYYKIGRQWLKAAASTEFRGWVLIGVVQF